MTRRRALAVAIAVAASWWWPAPQASAHQGNENPVTGHTRTRITAVTPQVPGLTVRVADLDGRVHLSWTGAGPLIVLGYEGEPYLRLEDGSVSRNVRSPATYLNEDLYAAVSLPPGASASAEPEWETLATGDSVSWHDHRTHYMSPGTPPEAEGADEPVVIIPEWQIDLEVGTTPVAVTGDVTWLPSPPSQWWWTAAVLGGAALAAILVVVQSWAAAALLGMLGGALFTLDSLGYLVRWSPNALGALWLVIWPAVAVGGALWAWRRAPRPSAGLALCGVVLAVVGGFDRIDVLGAPLVDSSAPGWFTRISTTTCLAVGAALLVRYLVWLVPAALLPPRPAAAGQHHPGA